MTAWDLPGGALQRPLEIGHADRLGRPETARPGRRSAGADLQLDPAGGGVDADDPPERLVAVDVDGGASDLGVLRRERVAPERRAGRPRQRPLGDGIAELAQGGAVSDELLVGQITHPVEVPPLRLGLPPMPADQPRQQRTAGVAQLAGEGRLAGFGLAQRLARRPVGDGRARLRSVDGLELGPAAFEPRVQVVGGADVVPVVSGDRVEDGPVALDQPALVGGVVIYVHAWVGREAGDEVGEQITGQLLLLLRAVRPVGGEPAVAVAQPGKVLTPVPVRSVGAAFEVEVDVAGARGGEAQQAEPGSRLEDLVLRSAGGPLGDLEPGLGLEADPAGGADRGRKLSGIGRRELGDRACPGGLQGDPVVDPHERHQRQVVLPAPLRLATLRPEEWPPRRLGRSTRNRKSARPRRPACRNVAWYTTSTPERRASAVNDTRSDISKRSGISTTDLSESFNRCRYAFSWSKPNRNTSSNASSTSPGGSSFPLRPGDRGSSDGRTPSAR